MLKYGLVQLNLKKSLVDPCLYYKDGFICAIYMEDKIFWSPDDSKIDWTISELKSLNFDLIYDGEVDSFLGIKIDTLDDDTLGMFQSALIEKL